MSGELRSRVSRLANSVRIFGARNTAVTVWNRKQAQHVHIPDKYDLRTGYKTETSEQNSPYVLAVCPDAIPYEPTHSAVLRNFLRALPVEFAKFRFVDVGCGKGRAVLMASEFSFAKVAGVELCDKLAAQARENIEREHPARECPDVEIVRGNAGDLPPPDAPTIYYLFNPFGPQTLTRFLKSIEQSTTDWPVYLAYCNLGANRPTLEQFPYECVLDAPVLQRGWSCSLWRRVCQLS